MDSPSHRSDAQPKPSFAELFTPKLVTVLREGYGWDKLRSDVIAGLTVAIVALPLSMAIAIASGTTPDRGLYTAIIGGFIISALGGSRFQIGGPAGAFIVLVAATVQQHGVDGMLLATLIAGLILMAIGLLRLGTYVKFIPYPVTVGFTAGIAVIIFASQIKDLLGLTLHEAEPAELVEKLEVLAGALGTFNVAAAALALLSILIIVGLKRWRPGWPGMLVAVGLTAILALAFKLPVETIGTRFGGIPSSLPMPALPQISLEKLQAVLPNAVAFALLGAIESLLSAVVADGMTGRRHRSNSELVAQGLANIASSLFGGVPATGTIARTATNVRAGAHGPVSGMLHSAFLLAFMLVAAPLASYIPLAALAGVLAVVAWNMAEKHAIWTLLRSSRGDALVLLSTLLLTIFKDLTYGIVVGFTLAALQFINRMAKGTEVAPGAAGPLDDVADGATPYDPAMSSDRDVVVYRISGAFFFAAASSVSAVLDRIADQHKALVIDFGAVSLLDSTAANAIAGVVGGAARKGVAIYLSGTKPYVRQTLANHGVSAPQAHFVDTIADAVAKAHERSAEA
ncbi:MAG: STAS domain-containing protein [Devosia sp.]|nr:STAS domain-containing protein [Devosia sp.]